MLLLLLLLLCRCRRRPRRHTSPAATAAAQGARRTMAPLTFWQVPIPVASSCGPVA